MSDHSLFSSYKFQFESDLKKSIAYFGEKNKLRDACEYALLNGGKRFRPIIVMMVAHALGHQLNVQDASLSVEFFHTASLIADDLPCMDNDDYRREKPSVHQVFGETVALLASYALITQGFEMIYQSARAFPKESEVGILALSCATRGAGVLGATGGQFLDLFPKGNSLENLREVIEKKTVTLFEVAFAFGWLFGGGKIDFLEEVKLAASHFGMAFQIVDDLDDLRQDNEKRETLNIGLCLGIQEANNLFREEMQAFESQMKKLNVFSLEFQQLSEFMFDKLSQLHFS